MNIERFPESSIDPETLLFEESGGMILERSDSNDLDSKPIKWICGMDEDGEHIHPSEVTDLIYAHLDNKGQWIGTTIKPKDMADWNTH